MENDLRVWPARESAKVVNYNVNGHSGDKSRGGGKTIAQGGKGCEKIGFFHSENGIFADREYFICFIGFRTTLPRVFP